MRKMTVRVAEDGSEEPTKLGLLATDLSTKLQTGGKVVAGSLAASTSKVGKGFTAVGGKLAKKVTKSEVVQVWCLATRPAGDNRLRALPFVHTGIPPQLGNQEGEASGEARQQAAPA